MPNTVIALKKSATPTAAPTNLANGELAINYADGILYYKAANGAIASIQSLEGNSFGTVNANGTLIVSDTVGDFLTMVSGNNISIVGDAINDRITIQLADDVVIPRTGTFKVSAVGNDEGGEIKLGNAITNSVLAGDIIIDIFQNRLRFFESGSPNRGAFINLAAASVGVGTDLLASSFGADATARVTANAAFLHANSAFDKANAALPNVSGASFNGNLTVSQNLSADRIFSTNNGNGENFKVGDDAWIGDTNLSDTIRIKGQQNPFNAFIALGNNDGVLLGRSGSGPLIFNGQTIWHAGNDGIGSGLDADLLDGQNGTYYGIATDVTAAFARANTANITADRAWNHANAAFITANIAFANANTVMVSAQAAFTVANSSFLHANAAYAFANSIATTANAALPNTSGVTFNGTLNASQNLSADKIIATNNGNGENFRVGDDVWIGDYNVSNSIKIKGVQNSQIAYISFGTGDNKALGRDGTNNLTYDNNIVWHQGNDGSGSGLDADLLDGFHGTHYGTADNLNAAYTHANNAFNRANTANITADRAWNHANAAFISANIAFANANTVMISAQAAFTVANASFLHANAAFAATNASFGQANTARVHANVAFEQANTATALATAAQSIANLAFIHANAAFASSNADYAFSNSAHAIANLAFTHANAAFASSNADYAFSNSAHTIANLAFTHANAAFAQANTARIHANAAFASSNSVNTYSDSTYVKLSAPSQTITGNLNIVGDFTLSGNTFAIDATRLEVDDPLLYLAANNYTSDIVDIGFIANYVNATGQNVHTGLYREHEDKMYYLFQGYDREPINNHIGALSNNMTLAVLNADIRTSNLVLGGANAILTIGAAFNHANAAHVSANAGMAIANGAFASANAAQATANAAFNRANTANITADRAWNHANAAFLAANNALSNTSGVSFNGALTIPGELTIGANLNFDTTLSTKINDPGSNVMTFHTTQTERMRIDSSGRVGIGTTSPSNTFHVVGTANISGTLKSAGLQDSSNRLLLIRDSTGTVVWGN